MPPGFLYDLTFFMLTVLLICVSLYHSNSKTNKIMKTAIGQLKSKVTKHCEICGCSTKRNLTANVYENNEAQIEQAKQEIKNKASKKYICKVCKSIERDLKK